MLKLTSYDFSELVIQSSQPVQNGYSNCYPQQHCNLWGEQACIWTWHKYVNIYQSIYCVTWLVTKTKWNSKAKLTRLIFPMFLLWLYITYMTGYGNLYLGVEPSYMYNIVIFFDVFLFNNIDTLFLFSNPRHTAKICNGNLVFHLIVQCTEYCSTVLTL